MVKRERVSTIIDYYASFDLVFKHMLFSLHLIFFDNCTKGCRRTEEERRPSFTLVEMLFGLYYPRRCSQQFGIWDISHQREHQKEHQRDDCRNNFHKVRNQQRLHVCGCFSCENTSFQLHGVKLTEPRSHQGHRARTIKTAVICLALKRLCHAIFSSSGLKP